MHRRGAKNLPFIQLSLNTLCFGEPEEEEERAT